MEKKITKENFKKTVLESEKTVLIDFFATWCGPCSQLAPIVEKVANEHSEFVVGKVNVDNEIELATKFGIVSIPTLVVFKNGILVDKQVGFCTEAEILDMLSKAE